MRILIATDAWVPQVNGVVRTYQRVQKELEEMGHEVRFVTPSDYFTMPCPTYPEIRLSFVRPGQIARIFKSFSPDIVHIATEGPIGWAARRACLRAGRPFTTAYHTRFPEYIAKRMPVPAAFVYRLMRRFHNRSAGTLVATPSLARELAGRGFTRLAAWTRGVDTAIFRPREKRILGDGPVALYVGRVAVEKNIEAFLDLELDGALAGMRRVVVGDGPSLDELRQRYREVTFTGAKEGEALAELYAAADVFVFPSRTDTFGIVMLEAMASGVPVAAYPVTGPIDVIEPGVTGAMDEDLAVAVTEALKLDRGKCREAALGFSWRHCADLFVEVLETARSGKE